MARAAIAIYAYLRYLYCTKINPKVFPPLPPIGVYFGTVQVPKVRINCNRGACFSFGLKLQSRRVPLLCYGTVPKYEKRNITIVKNKLIKLNHMIKL